MSDSPQALVIGAGPAGLMAAEMLASGGAQVVLAEAMPSPARKFLMAGKSGLNLTKDEPADIFATRFSAPVMSADFGPQQVMGWARGLGIELFTGSTGRVFPVGMKASPLLRAWLARLRLQGVELRTRWRWTGLEDGGFRFDTPQGPQMLRPLVAVLALGGASWPRLGANGDWVAILREAGVELADFRPANMGFLVQWSDPMARYFGHAVKGTAITAGDMRTRGEWVVTRHGVEGGGIYELAAPIRDGAAAFVDLAPDLDDAALRRRFARDRGRLSVGNWLRRVLGDPVKVALLLEWGGPQARDAVAWAALARNLPMRLQGPMGLARAISTAGGLCWTELDEGLQLRRLPGIFAAGEMLDWEAPTGGYLLSGCLAGGRIAGRTALRHLSRLNAGSL